MKIQNFLNAVVAAGLLLTASSQAVIVYNNPTTLTGNEAIPSPLRLGMDFTVAGGGWVTAMGAFDNGGDGFLGVPIEVGIFDLGSLALVPGTYAVFSGAADPLIGGSRFQSILPVFLGPGTYSIVAANYGNVAGFERNYNSGVVPVSLTPPTFDNALNHLTMLGHREDFGGGLSLPAGSFFAGANPAFGAGTFDFTPVPEPETYGLIGILVLGLVYVGRNYVISRRLV